MYQKNKQKEDCFEQFLDFDVKIDSCTKQHRLKVGYGLINRIETMAFLSLD
jgi:hypothetical protein